MNKNARRIWLLVSFFVAGGVAHLLVRASAAERERLQYNYDRIAAMSHVDRLRLERNFEEFSQMSPADQERYRRLHNDLEADRHDEGVHVEVMDSYYNWLETVRGDQREALRKEADPQARRDLVEAIVDEQTAPPPEFGDQRGRRNHKLTSEQLDRVFNEIAAQVPNLYSEELDALTGVQRHLRFLELLITRFRPTGDEMWIVPAIFKQLYDQDRLDGALAVIDDQALRRHIEQNEENPEGHDPGVAFGWLVWWSIAMELGEFRMQNMPTDEQLNSLFNSLSEAEQDELLALSAQDFRGVLTDKFHELQLRELSSSDDIFMLYRPWRPRPQDWRRGGGFGGGQGNGGPGGGPGNGPMREDENDGGRQFGNGPRGNGPRGNRDNDDQGDGRDDDDRRGDDDRNDS